MTWILIRHAHRNTTVRALDNGLSSKGRAQARSLARYFRHRFGKRGRGILLVSSPKKRCMQTLEPVARQLRSKVLEDALLLEQGALETQAALEARVTRFLRKRRTAAQTVVLCSHGDWLPIALERLCGAKADLKKGAWVEVEGDQLVRILQPDDLELA